MVLGVARTALDLIWAEDSDALRLCVCALMTCPLYDTSSKISVRLLSDIEVYTQICCQNVVNIVFILDARLLMSALTVTLWTQVNLKSSV